MFAQLFEGFRKASEATLQAQQDLFRQWLQNWPSLPVSTPGAAGTAGEWREGVQKRWLDSTKETLNKQRELLDGSYRSGIDVIEQTFRVTDAKSPEEYRGLVEELWRKLSDNFRAQSESQFREFQSAAEKWFEIARNAGTAAADATRNYRDSQQQAYADAQAARA